MKTNRNNISTLFLAAAALAIVACTDQSSQQVWTTKNQSVLATKKDGPALSPGEGLLSIGPAPTAAELRESAVSLLLQATESSNPQLRANAIEALHEAPEHLEPIVLRALGDENRGVRFVAAMTVGKLKLQNLTTLLEPLLHDESQSVQAAAMYGLKRCGRVVDLNPLAAMLTQDDPETKGNVAFILGELGDRSALALLQYAAGRNMSAARVRRKIVELQLAEAMVKLGSRRDLDVIRAALYATADDAELSALACQMCGELKDGAALADLTNLVHRTGKTERPPEIRMAAALAAARIDPQREFIEVPAAFASATRAEWRAQAAHTLGAMKTSDKATMVAVAHLSRLMNDPNPLVQVAAAGGILQLQPPPDR